MKCTWPRFLGLQEVLQAWSREMFSPICSCTWKIWRHMCRFCDTTIHEQPSRPLQGKLSLAFGMYIRCIRKWMQLCSECDYLQMPLQLQLSFLEKAYQISQHELAWKVIAPQLLLEPVREDQTPQPLVLLESPR
nr:hypothetical protein Iba_chr14dCG18460 [Ipomoea batatas]